MLKTGTQCQIIEEILAVIENLRCIHKGNAVIMIQKLTEVLQAAGQKHRGIHGLKKIGQI